MKKTIILDGVAIPCVRRKALFCSKEGAPVRKPGRMRASPSSSPDCGRGKPHLYGENVS